ncbi:aminotransferase class IV [Megamonas funiformis]|uniref:Aminotransferase class IV n=1 Tax=Megamonas funiformis TaxID=437897 RepID=A0AAW4U976_9FIRM|nr:aminotransferase class IV [Megamonas funiformis]MCB6828801.1 aminotransferase class IV [Megamonas funiformis]
MKTLGYYNGKYDEIDKIMIPMSDRSHWFGDGVYDATCARNYKIMAIDEHVDRFFNSARLLNINLGFTKEYLKDLLNELVQKLDDDELFVYWQATRGGNGLRSHNYDKEQKANLWITICPEEITDKDKEYKLTSMEDTRFLHCNIKTLNLIPSVVAYQYAKENNCDETVFHRGDIVTECAHSNVHIIKDKKFITHPADEYILPGIARAHLLKACKALNIEVEERPFTVDELINADEVIVSSSGDLCIRATEFEGKAVGKKDNDTFNRLKEYIYQEWLECTKK